MDVLNRNKVQTETNKKLSNRRAISIKITFVSRPLQEDIKNPFITLEAKNKNSDSHSNTAAAKSGEASCNVYFGSAFVNTAPVTVENGILDYE
ncbi:hypothetical protein RR46_03325 [Papilio xuthus]|uniref:Uncharacterized protein n=1 Tax=Papilio xuthus TaxID=66420 RepID=A0A194Q957_PAPXU|nr:hypothetical protein RR46_03325 [Papilio xuthus]